MQQNAIGAEAKSREESGDPSEKRLGAGDQGDEDLRAGVFRAAEDVARSGADLGSAEDGGGGKAGFCEIESGGEFSGENGGEVGVGIGDQEMAGGLGLLRLRLTIEGGMEALNGVPRRLGFFDPSEGEIVECRGRGRQLEAEHGSAAAGIRRHPTALGEIALDGADGVGMDLAAAGEIAQTGEALAGRFRGESCGSMI